MKKLKGFKIIHKIMNYDQYNIISEKSIKDNIELLEKALNSDDIQDIKRLKKSGDISGILKSLNSISEKIKELIRNIDYTQINLSIEKGDYIEVYYTKDIDDLLYSLKREFIGIENNKIKQLFFNGGYTSLTLGIELDHSNLNEIDIMNGLPNFMKNLGLGKKIYKKLIKDFDYISSFNGSGHSLDSDMVWKSIVTDKEIFSFANDDNLISFWNELDYQTILDKLKIFYNIKGEIKIDEDFLMKYNLTREEFIKII